MVVKLAFLAAIPIYCLVSWFVVQNPLQPPPDPAVFSLMAKMLAGIYMATLLFVEPMVSRSSMQRLGGYNYNVMVLKLAFFESGALYGLVLTLITHHMAYVTGFGMVAFLMILLRAPAAALPNRG